jgi:subtilisin family serine protease
MRKRTEAAMERIASHPDIESVEENCLLQLHSQVGGSQATVAPNPLVPNDPNYSKQWALPIVQAPQGWATSTGSSNVVVAVIDSGIDVTHTDLQNNIWTNAAEVNGKPGVDDDGNGYVDDIYGYNFADGNANPFPGTGPDDPHGTHIAGIIGAQGNNGIGVAGLNWNVRLMAVRVFPSAGSGTIAEMLEGVYYAVNNGARIINCSWGGVGPSTQSELQAFAYAISKNVLPVVSAGNNNLDSSLSSPANIPGVLVVGASDASNNLADFSNYGTGVQVLAPGTGIYSTVPQSQYDYMTGTSMAAPFVAGTAALILANNPTLTQVQLQQILVASGQPLTVSTSPGGNVRAQYPLLNIPAALQMANQISAPGSSTTMSSNSSPTNSSPTVTSSSCSGNCSATAPSGASVTNAEGSMSGCSHNGAARGPSPWSATVLLLPIMMLLVLRRFGFSIIEKRSHTPYMLEI